VTLCTSKRISKETAVVYFVYALLSQISSEGTKGKRGKFSVRGTNLRHQKQEAGIIVTEQLCSV
jgi:hypothetical protein